MFSQSFLSSVVAPKRASAVAVTLCSFQALGGRRLGCTGGREGGHRNHDISTMVQFHSLLVDVAFLKISKLFKSNGGQFHAFPVC